MTSIEQIRTDLMAGAHRARLARLYCCGEDETEIYAERCAELLTAFAGRFGNDGEVAMFSSPGRSEIGGNHTDHQHGQILACGVNLDILAVARPNGRNEVRLASDTEETEAISLDTLEPDPSEHFRSRALVKGIASRFRQAGYEAGGFDVCTTSMVLRGSGLSSSAAFEVLIGCIFNSLFCADAVLAVDVARFGQYAENIHFGKPCGLMDQLACAVGGIQFMDFRDAENPLLRRVSLDLGACGLALCIVDSGGDHADMSGVYATIPEDMGRVAAELNAPWLAAASKDDFLNNIAAIRAKTGDRAVLRALHFFDETRRAADEAAALEAGRIDDFLALVSESGRSSYMYLQNVIPPGAERHQELAFALGLCGEILGKRGAYRVHGGGFAGTIQAFVPHDMVETFTLEIEAALGRGACHTLAIRPEGGVRVL